MKRWLNRHSTGVMLLPYVTLFTLFIVIPVVTAVILSFTYFNTIQFPTFNGLKNYVALLTQDAVFMQNIIPNTVVFSIVTGIGGYILAFILAWAISQVTRWPRTVMALIIYSPSLTGGVMLTNVWSVFFNGDQSGWLNYILMNLNVIQTPVMWLQDERYLLTIMMIVTLWSSMGVGFLAILAGILNGNEELYEAAYIDGVKNRFQEIIYVTIPSAKPQMLFGAIMAIVGTIQAGSIGVALTGANPTPNNAGGVIVTHIDDYGFIRFEMGYAAAISVALLIFMRLASVGAEKLFGSEGE